LDAGASRWLVRVFRQMSWRVTRLAVQPVREFLAPALIAERWNVVLHLRQPLPSVQWWLWLGYTGLQRPVPCLCFRTTDQDHRQSDRGARDSAIVQQVRRLAEVLFLPRRHLRA